MSKEVRQDFRFYITLGLGFALLVIGCLIDPPGVISSSVLIGSGMLLTLTAGIIGVDLSKIIREFRFLQAGIQLTDEEKEEIKKGFIDEINK